MKTIIPRRTPFKLFTTLLVVGFAVATLPLARGVLLVYEGFDYPDGTDIAGLNGGNGWSSAWGTSGTSPVQAGSLSYSNGAVLATTGGKWLNTGTGGTSQPSRDMSMQRGDDNTVTWVSFLAQRIGDKTGTGGSGGSPTYERGANIALFFNDTVNATTPEQLDIGESSGLTNDTWMLRAPANGGSRVDTFSTNAIDQVSLLVVRLDHFAGTNDSAFLWVNPVIGIQPDTNNAAAKVLGNKEFTFNRIRAFAGGVSGAQAFAQWYVDEFRVGETYADVTPTAGVVVGTSSRWAKITILGNAAELSLNGTAGATYTVQASSDLANSNGWVNIGSVTLDGAGAGTFSDTNALPGNLRRFYRASSP